MKFLADVNIPQSVINLLRQQKHDILDLKRTNLKSSDSRLLEIAYREGRIILTLDKDFIQLFETSKYKIGVILVNLSNPNANSIFMYLTQLIKNQKSSVLRKNLTIIQEK